MYEQFFGLNEKPFNILPDPSYLYLSEGHAKALTLLRYSIVGRQGFTVVTGEIGSGKTTLINRLLNELDEDITVGLLNYTEPGVADLSEWVSMAFCLDYSGKSPVELYDEFISFLIRQYAQNKYTVLIIDEAQNLVTSGLEKVRMLSNVNAQKEHLLHLVLVGQPELRDLLATPGLEQLVQRISVSYHLDRLPPNDAREYILHRLRVAGATENVFSPEAMGILIDASGGVPRVINTLCDLALVYAYSDGSKIVEASVAKAVLEDRQKMGLSSPSVSPAGSPDHPDANTGQPSSGN